MEEKRGSIAFFSTYRPPVPLDIFSCPVTPASKKDEVPLTDGVSYNYNAQLIPPATLKTILKRPKLASFGTAADVDSGRLSGLVFVSERTNHLETLHIALRQRGKQDDVRVFSFADVFGTFDGVRMEDNGSVAGDHLIYVTTKDQPSKRRQPWTAVYKTNLTTGQTDRITPFGQADISPSVSPSGKKIAIASFQRKPGGWKGEIQDLMTDIYVMNVDSPFDRKLVVKNGGWPTWGSDNIIFFHRKVGKFWGVFRADISNGPVTADSVERVTPDGIHAITPAAINTTTVAVATIRRDSEFTDVREEDQYRHIEVFEFTGGECYQSFTAITRKLRPKADHFNPFVIDGQKRIIGYHRCRSDLLKGGDDIGRQSQKLTSPVRDIGLFRVPGAFPSFSSDGSKLAFVDNEFRAVWLADSQGLRIVYEPNGAIDNVFSPVWNKNPEKDTLYVCRGPSFHSDQVLHIHALKNVSSGVVERTHRMTRGFNNAFPSTNPQGTKLVFRSTRDGGETRNKNLYIMDDVELGEFGGLTRLTEGPWTDTHCEWSPNGDWIVFSSTRDKPNSAPEKDNNLDPGYFAVYLVKADDPNVVVRVIGSDAISHAGHVNHPFFSPDGKSIVVTSDFAGVSVDPVSMPLFLHSVRPYGDIFTIDIDSDDIKKNKDVKKFNRITHSRYENSTATWTMFSTQDPHEVWNMILDKPFSPSCPYAHRDGGESWHMTGRLCVRKACC